MTQLTKDQERRIERARELVNLTNPDDVREHTGTQHLDMAYAIMTGEMGYHVKELLAIIAELAA
jgi:hypothetical protein